MTKLMKLTFEQRLMLYTQGESGIMLFLLLIDNNFYCEPNINKKKIEVLHKLIMRYLDLNRMMIITLQHR